MKHFKTSVPAVLVTKLSALADLVESEWGNIVTGNKRHGAEGDPTLNEIEGNYKSGWLPHQDGGFSVDCFYQSDIDSGYHFTKKQTDFVNEQSKQAYSSYLRDYGYDSETSYDELPEKAQEQLFDYEREWMESALFQVQMFIEGYGTYDDGKKQIVTVRTSINYSDAPYYREKSAEDITVIVYEVDEFLSLDNKDIIAQLAL